LWMNNADWYRGRPGTRYPDPDYRFVLLDPTPIGLSRKDIRHTLGEPRGLIPLGNGDEVVLIAPAPDGLLSRAFEYDLEFLNQQFQDRPTTPLRLPACSLWRERGRNEPPARGGVQGRDGPGILAAGPRVRLRP